MKPKLIRDRVPDLIVENEKKTPQVYQASDEEYWLKLKEKSLEELNELKKKKALSHGTFSKQFILTSIQEK